MRYVSSLRKTPFQFITQAQRHSTKKYPDIKWGEWHQGPGGNMTLIGRISETSDPVVITKCLS